MSEENEQLSEAAIYALKIIHLMMSRPMEHQLNTKHLNTLWHIVENAAYLPIVKKEIHL